MHVDFSSAKFSAMAEFLTHMCADLANLHYNAAIFLRVQNSILVEIWCENAKNIQIQ